MDTNKCNDENVSLTDIETGSSVNVEVSETESMNMNEINAESTRTVSRVQKLSLDDIFNFMKAQDVKNESRLTEINSNFSNKFDKLSDVSEVKTSFEVQDNKFNELKNDIKEINKNVEKTNEIFTSNVSKLERNIERMGVWVINTGKSNTNENNGDICINSSGGSLDAKQVAVDKVSSDNYNDELTSDNSGIIKNVVLESKVVSRESVEKMGSVCEERLGGQRENFPQVYSETGFSPWCYEDKVSSGSCVGDMVSQNSPLIFCGVLGLSLIHI